MAATPFYAAPAGGSRAERRLLLVSHSFPPIRFVGALRWQKLGELAAARGWALDVIMQQPQPEAAADASQLAAVPDGARLYGVPLRESLLEQTQRAVKRAARRTPARSPESHGAPAGSATPADGPLSRLKRANRVGLYYAAHRKWAREAAALARDIVTPRHVGVISSGPPHMAHIAAAEIARNHALPLFIDMRDPWSLGRRTGRELDSGLWWVLARHYERQVVRAASLVIANTEMFRRAMIQRYPELDGRTLTVMNGSDDDPLPQRQVTDRFVVAYAGSLYWDRDPRPLFRAAAIVIRQLGLRPDQFAVELMGDVRLAEGESVEEIARSERIADYVHLHDDDTRWRAMEFLARADLLVSLPLVVSHSSRDAEVDITVPAKIFEYMRFDAWVLALADPGSATSEFLRDTAADVVAPHDVAGIAEVLLRRYRDRANGVRPRAIEDGRFSRRTQGLRLLDALEPYLAAVEARRDAAHGTRGRAPESSRPPKR
ncbi:MAG TPA: hypothetical protein VFZ56_00380 [Gemmatimonadaceae bacterium]